MPERSIRNWQWIEYKNLRVHGMTVFPFILVRNRGYIADTRFVRHEHIHLRQQREMLIIPFYILYVMQYLINRLRFNTHDLAYRNICFEKEAYRNEQDEHYLQKRKFFSWARYL